MNILSFDVEEWFHILDNDSTRTEDNWSRYESRIDRNMDRIFELLQSNNQNATFFCLGWIARKHPAVIRKIDALGYHIGCHSDMHQLAYQQTRSEFRKDLRVSLDAIQDITGKKITCYRAPGFSLMEQNKWVFDELIAHGIEIDCSVFPAKRAHGGFESFGISEPCYVVSGSNRIKEFPMNLVRLLTRPTAFSGGGYFRIFPYWYLKSEIKKAHYVMTYFHPRDFDADQPIIRNLDAIRKFKTYYGISGCYAKLDALLKEIQFIDVLTADKMVDWGKVPVRSLAQETER